MKYEQDYVVGFYFDKNQKRVVLIKKAKPEWQAGKLNGVGGKIENGESALNAMVREFREETGLQTTHDSWMHYASMGCAGGKWGVEFFYKIARSNLEFEESINHILSLQRQKMRENGEMAGIYHVSALPTYDIVENLLWQIHLGIDSIDGRPQFTNIIYP